jgi:hypothetical protein
VPWRDLDFGGTLNVTLRAGGQTTRLSRELLEPLLVEHAVRD